MALSTLVTAGIYENWAIGYMMPNLDPAGSGLIEGSNNDGMNLQFGTYIQFDGAAAGDTDIYDAATIKNVFDPETDQAIDGAFESDVTEYLENNDSNLDESILSDLDLRGITPLKISQTIYDGESEVPEVTEYYVVDWSYGETARPSFTYYKTGESTGNQYYFVSYNGDKKSIQEKFQVKGGALSEGYENLISDVINNTVATLTSTSEPTFNFKKAKKKKINCEDLSVFPPETGTAVDITTTTTATSY